MRCSEYCCPVALSHHYCQITRHFKGGQNVRGETCRAGGRKREGVSHWPQHSKIRANLSSGRGREGDDRQATDQWQGWSWTWPANHRAAPVAEWKLARGAGRGRVEIVLSWARPGQRCLLQSRLALVTRTTSTSQVGRQRGVPLTFNQNTLNEENTSLILKLSF